MTQEQNEDEQMDDGTLHEEEWEEEDEFERDFFMELDNIKLEYAEPMSTEVRIDGKKVKLYIDEGACVNLISKAMVKSEIEPYVLNGLQCINGSSLMVIGKVSMRIEVGNGKSFEETFLVTEEDIPITLGAPGIISQQVERLFPDGDIIVVNFKKLGVKHLIHKTRGSVRVVGNVHQVDQTSEDRTEYMNAMDWDLSGVPAHAKQRLRTILFNYRHVFYKNGPLPQMNRYQYDIHYEGPSFSARVINAKSEYVEAMNEQCDTMIKHGTAVEVKEARAPLQYVSAGFIRKQPDKLRLCVDYRHLNEASHTYQYEIPDKEQFISTMSGFDYYIALDFKSAYNQVPLTEKAMQLLTFVIPGKDGSPRYIRPTRATFGSANMPAFFQHIATTNFQNINTRIYIDDIFIRIRKGEENKGLDDLEHVLKKADELGMVFSGKKCQLFVDKIAMLGEIVDKNGHHADPRRLQGINMLTEPKTTKDVRSFLGLFNFVASHIPNHITPELRILQKVANKTNGRVDDEVIEAWHKVKEQMKDMITLSPYDPDKPVIIYTDASIFGMGALLTQEFDGELRVIFTYSKVLPPAAINYSVHDRETFAIISTLKRFQRILLFREVVVYCDCQDAVTMLTTTKFENLPAKYRRYRMYLQSNFHITIKHIAGAKNAAADCLSRQRAFTSALEQRIGAVMLEPDEIADDIFLNPLLSSLLEAQGMDDEEYESTRQAKFSREQPGLEGILCKISKDGTQIVVPEAMRKQIMAHYHDNFGHNGVESTSNRIAEQYWWKTMQKDVQEYVKTCTACQMNKSIRHRPFKGKARTVSELFEMISLDLIEMPTRSKGYKYVLVAMDEFSGFVLLKPLRDKTADNVASQIWNVATLFGPPQRILSDQGKEFTNELARELLKHIGTQTYLTFPYYAQGNSRNERSHRVINDTLRILSGGRTNAWHEYLPAVQFMMNTRVNNIGISPYMMVFARRPRLMDTAPSTIKPYSHDEYATLADIAETIRELYGNVRSEYRKITPLPFEVGDQVTLSRNILKDKMLTRNLGPYTITRQIGNSGFELEHNITGEKTTASGSQLTLYYTRNEGENQDKQNLGTENPEEEASESNEMDMNDMEQENDDAIEEDHKLVTSDETIVEEEEHKEKGTKKKKRNRALYELQSYNRPTKEISTKRPRRLPAIGTFVIFRQNQDDEAKLGQTIAVDRTSQMVTLHLYTNDDDDDPNVWTPTYHNDDGQIISTNHYEPGLSPETENITLDAVEKTFGALVNNVAIPNHLWSFVQGKDN